MRLPGAPEARPFYQSALQRFEDATALLGLGRTAGAVYLAGYAVECTLKALLLAAEPRGRRAATLKSFRGVRGHDLEWLRARYRSCGGPALPAAVVREFVEVDRWQTAMRYAARTIPAEDARRFFRATRAILAWAEGRF